jgi:hypothetical protein
VKGYNRERRGERSAVLYKGGAEKRPYYLLRARAAVVQPAAEGGDLRLPLVAEGQDQHLLVDVRVLGQRLHRAAACRREHFVRRLPLLVERRERRDLRRLLARRIRVHGTEGRGTIAEQEVFNARLCKDLP